MAKPDIFFVHLRRPKNSRDQRDDPFYEVGSFGCTGCHSRNLLHPKNAHKLKGARLAFVQGGTHGSRLVLLTPSVTVVKMWLKYDKGKWVPIREVKWKKTDPLRYSHAPVLVSNDGHSHFPSVMKAVRRAHGPSLVSSLSSLLRSRTGKLDETMAKEVDRVYKKWRRKAVARSGIASNYCDTMCPAPRNPDSRRRATYRKRIKELVPDNDGTECLLRAKVPPRKTLLGTAARARPRCARA